MMVLNLEGLQFEARNGMYEVEKKITTRFILDVSLHFEVQHTQPLQLRDTIDYAAVYQLLKKEIHQHENLVENLLIRLHAAIKNHFPSCQYCKISLAKEAQLGGSIHKVSLTFDGQNG